MCLAALQAQTQHFLLSSSSVFSHHLSLFLTLFLSASQTFSCWQSTYSVCAKRTGGAYTNTAAASSSPLAVRPRQTQSEPNGRREFNFLPETSRILLLVILGFSLNCAEMTTFFFFSCVCVQVTSGGFTRRVRSQLQVEIPPVPFPVSCKC